MTIRIRTEYVFPPIPVRTCDWSAVDDSTYDGEGSAIGWGPTEAAATDDLLSQIQDRAEEWRDRCQSRVNSLQGIAADMTDAMEAAVNRVVVDEHSEVRIDLLDHSGFSSRASEAVESLMWRIVSKAEDDLSDAQCDLDEVEELIAERAYAAKYRRAA